MKQKSLLALLATLALLLASQLPVPAGQPTPAAMSFTLTRLTNNTVEDTQPTLAMDSAGKAHVAYERGGDIYYATNTSGSWVTSPVSTTPADERYPAIAVDGSGHAYVAYLAGSLPNLDIYYATNLSGSWTSEDVGDMNWPWVGHEQLGLALDDDGRAYITYPTADGSDIEITVRYQESNRGAGPQGGWVSLPVTDNTVQDLYPSIAVDSSGAIHVAYQGSNPTTYNYDIWHATYNGSSWHLDQITDIDGTSDTWPSLALDGAGKAHVAWEVIEGAYTPVIGYATNASGAWITTTLTANSDWETNPSLVMDGNGQAHIVYEYFDWSRHHILHLSNTSGAWLTDTVATATVHDTFLAANDHALALDEAGYAHVVYYDNDGNDDEVWYAHSDQPLGPPANRPPNTPSGPTPPHQATGVDLEDNVLSWSGGDPDAGDTVTYDVYLGSSSPPPLAQDGWPNSNLTVTLDADTHYFWQIVARDDHGAETEGPIWEFTTGSDNFTCYLPFVVRNY